MTSIELDFYSGFQLKANTQTRDTGGAIINTWANSGDSFSGYIRKLSGNEIITNQKRGIKSTHRFYCAADVSITNLNQLTFDSKTYHVTYVDNPHELDEFLQVELLYNEINT